MSRKTDPQKREAIKARKQAIKEHAKFVDDNREFLCSDLVCTRLATKNGLCDYHQPEAVAERKRAARRASLLAMPAVAVAAGAMVASRYKS